MSIFFYKKISSCSAFWVFLVRRRTIEGSESSIGRGQRNLSYIKPELIHSLFSSSFLFFFISPSFPFFIIWKEFFIAALAALFGPISNLMRLDCCCCCCVDDEIWFNFSSLFLLPCQQVHQVQSNENLDDQFQSASQTHTRSIAWCSQENIKM